MYAGCQSTCNVRTRRSSISTSNRCQGGKAVAACTRQSRNKSLRHENGIASQRVKCERTAAIPRLAHVGKQDHLTTKGQFESLQVRLHHACFGYSWRSKQIRPFVLVSSSLSYTSTRKPTTSRSEYFAVVGNKMLSIKNACENAASRETHNSAVLCATINIAAILRNCRGN